MQGKPEAILIIAPSTEQLAPDFSGPSFLSAKRDMMHGAVGHDMHAPEEPAMADGMPCPKSTGAALGESGMSPSDLRDWLMSVAAHALPDADVNIEVTENVDMDEPETKDAEADEEYK